MAMTTAAEGPSVSVRPEDMIAIRPSEDSAADPRTTPFHGDGDEEPGEPAFFTNADERGVAPVGGKPSFTVAQAAAQIDRDGYSWSNTLGTPIALTYSFRDTEPAPMPNGTSGFSRFNATQIVQAELALQSWAEVANITYTRIQNMEGYSDAGQIKFANYSAGAAGAAAFAYYPRSTSGAWFNSTQSANINPAYLNYGRQTLVHEIGHTLGLGHPGDYNAGGAPISYANSAVYHEDSRQYSVMSYWSEANTGGNNGGNYAAAPLLDDIAAVQRLYGANLATRIGNTVYGFNANAGRDYYGAATAASKLIFAAWDAGGTDTFDFSGYTQAQTIQLREGFFSSVGGLVGNVTIAIGAVIENANGGSGVDTMTGNAAANVLNGNNGADSLSGLGGNDILNGGAGVDYLDGGADNDMLYGDADNDILIGGAGADMTAGGAGNDQYLVDNASDQVVELVGGGSNDIVFALTGFGLTSGQEVEELAAASGAGTARLDLTGNEFANRLYGNAGVNVLIGGGGADLMAGFGGNDQYLVDNINDQVLESVGGGDDIVFTLTSFGLASGQEVEEIAAANGAGTQRLDLTGNAFANRLYGNDGLNVMIGGGGADLMAGFGGNDQYLVDSGDDRILEFVGGGDDIVFTLASFALTSGVEVEELSAANSAGTARLDLTGNEFANRLYGNAGVNVLIGGGGKDLMNGFGGDDQYLVDDTGDQVVEGANGGYDIVFALASYTLAAGVAAEELAAVAGAGALNLSGNELANAIYGNADANLLAGGGGADALTGHGGADSFLFNTSLATAGIDRILDFETGVDKIALDDATFGGLAGVPASAFVIGGQAQDSDDRIIYDSASGALLFDADGNGAVAAIQFATLNAGLSLSASDFIVI